MPKFGPSAIVEDFVPISDTRALISAGPGFRNLVVIAEVDWRTTQLTNVDNPYKEDGACIVLENPEIIRVGQYLRLGHYANERALIYSDGFTGPHQPFLHRGHIYWTNDAPDGRIYRDGELFIDHWPGIVEVSNPWVTDEAIYFEARDEGIAAPEGWWIWRSDLTGQNKHRVSRGANPCVYDGTLYYGIWNGSCFDIAARAY